MDDALAEVTQNAVQLALGLPLGRLTQLFHNPTPMQPFHSLYPNVRDEAKSLTDFIKISSFSSSIFCYHILTP